MGRRKPLINKRAADKAVFFIEHLKHTKGRWYGVPFKLAGWQEKEIIRPLFGTLNPDGTRRYRTAYIEIGRKNGKSELGAAIALDLLFADGERGGEIYSAAGDRDQASIVFNIASSMVRQSPTLERRCRVIDSVKRIVCYKTGSFYRAISAEAYTKHGFDAHGVIFDELHVQPNRELWDVLTTSGGTRSQPLVVAITTAGYDRDSICYEQHDYAEKVLKGIIDDPTFFAYIRCAEPDDDWTKVKTWRKANPALGDFRDLSELKTLYKRAREVPALENTFKRLYLNMWTAQETRWLPIEAWDACGGIAQEADFKGRVAYAGLDLASTVDIAAFVLVFPPLEDNEPIALLPYFWVPKENIRERAKKDRVPYDVWVRQGLIEATEGNVIDYGAIRKKVNDLGTIFNIKEVAFDRWGAAQISQDLAADGFTVVPFGQGFASMAAPTKELLNLVLQKKINHGGNPVLRWMADNMVVRTDPAGNVKPDKSKSREKIDGIVAAIMGLDRAIRHEDVRSVYEDRGII